MHRLSKFLRFLHRGGGDLHSLTKFNLNRLDFLLGNW